jgi:hypothetical protein
MYEPPPKLFEQPSDWWPATARRADQRAVVNYGVWVCSVAEGRGAVANPLPQLHDAAEFSVRNERCGFNFLVVTGLEAATPGPPDQHLFPDAG